MSARIARDVTVVPSAWPTSEHVVSPGRPAPRLPASPLARAAHALMHGGAFADTRSTPFVAHAQIEMRDGARGGRPGCSTILWCDEIGAIVARSISSADEIEALGEALLAHASEMRIHAEAVAQGEHHAMPRAIAPVMPGLRLGETRHG